MTFKYQTEINTRNFKMKFFGIFSIPSYTHVSLMHSFLSLTKLGFLLIVCNLVLLFVIHI